MASIYLRKFVKFQTLAFIFLCIGVLVGTSGCEKADDEPLIDIPSETDPGADNPALSATGIRVSVNSESEGWTSLMHKTTSIADECFVDKNAVSGNFIDCLLEVQEGSIMYRDIKLEIVAPPEMCRYFSFDNYYYYNFEPGVGPTTIQVEIQQDDEGNVVAPPQCDFGDGMGLQLCSAGGTEAVYDFEENRIRCLYDHKYRDDSFPNCCTGSYSLTTVIQDTVTPTTISSDVVGGEWGQSLDSMCYGGTAAQDMEWPKNANNRPVTEITNSWLEGYSRTYELFAPINLLRWQSQNLFVSNYWDLATPNMFTISTDRSGDAVSPPGDRNQNYHFECLDESYEVLHSIDLKIREWNRYDQFLLYLADGTGDYDLDGDETTPPGDCGYGTPDSNECDDRYDWDEWVTDFGTAYPEAVW